MSLFGVMLSPTMTCPSLLMKSSFFLVESSFFLVKSPCVSSESYCDILISLLKFPLFSGLMKCSFGGIRTCYLVKPICLAVEIHHLAEAPSCCARLQRMHKPPLSWFGQPGEQLFCPCQTSDCWSMLLYKRYLLMIHVPSVETKSLPVVPHKAVAEVSKIGNL